MGIGRFNIMEKLETSTSLINFNTLLLCLLGIQRSKSKSLIQLSRESFMYSVANLKTLNIKEKNVDLLLLIIIKSF